MNLNAVTVTGAGTRVSCAGALGAQVHVFSAAGSSATVTIEGSLDGIHWKVLATITNPTADGEVWKGTALPYLRANVTARVSGALSAVIETLASDPGAWASAIAAQVSSVSRYGLIKRQWTNAEVAALGASLTGDINVGTLPAKSAVMRTYVIIDTPDSSANALTVALGVTATAYADWIVASDAKALAGTVYGDAAAERGAAHLDGALFYATAQTVNLHFIKGTTNLSTVTGSTGTVYVEYVTYP